MSLVQDMFLVSQNSDDRQLQQYASWAVSFLRHYLWIREVRTEVSNLQNDAVRSKSASHSFPADSLVMELSMWLMHLNYPRVSLSTTIYLNLAVLRFCEVLSLVCSESVVILSQAVSVLWNMFILL